MISVEIVPCVLLKCKREKDMNNSYWLKRMNFGVKLKIWFIRLKKFKGVAFEVVAIYWYVTYVIAQHFTLTFV